MPSAEQQQQERTAPAEPDPASSWLGSSDALRDWLIVSTEIRAISENPPLPPRTDQRQIRTKEPVGSPSWRWLKVDLLLCVLLLIVSAAILEASLKARTGGSTGAALVNIESRGRTASVPLDNDRQPITNAVAPSLPPDNDEPRQPITNTVAPSLPLDNDELRQPITNAVKSSAVAPSPSPLSPAPLNEQPVEAEGPATAAASATPAPSPQCNIRVCQRLYRSFHRSDCTYQPFSAGPRRICDH